MGESSEFRNIEIINLNLNQDNDEKINKKVAFKYKTLKNQVNKAEQRLYNIFEVIKEKNPTLLKQISKYSHDI